MVECSDNLATEEREQGGFVAVDAGANKRRSNLGRGWYWGKQAFAEKLLKLCEAAIGRIRETRGQDASPEVKAHGEQKALAFLEEGLWVANLANEELVGHGCTEPRKVLLAGLL
jgi:putative transposase